MNGYKDVESDIKIYVTRDYDRFKFVDGNRAVKDGRVKKILQSIENIGLLPTPIVVNERYEIIDGQGRFVSCRQEGLPIYYIIIVGIGIQECISMNINQSNWTIRDYIGSYAKRGVKSYVYLSGLIDTFGKYFSLRTLHVAATGRIERTEEIKKGSLKITYEQRNNARYALTWLIEVSQYLSNVSGYKRYHEAALLFCYNDKDIDNDRLKKKLKQLYFNLSAVGGINEALRQIENIYNDHKKGRHVFIETKYREEQINKKKEAAA